MKSLYIVGEIVKWYNYFAKQSGSSSSIKHIIIIRSRNSTIRYLRKVSLHKNLYMSFHSSFINPFTSVQLLSHVRLFATL